MGFETSMDKEWGDNNDILARTIEDSPLGLDLCAHADWGGAGAYRISCSQIVLFVTEFSDRKKRTTDKAARTTLLTTYSI